VVERFAARIEWQLARRGASQAAEVGWALQAFLDGAMLHRLAGVETDQRARLSQGMRLLLAASMLGDDELDELLARFDRGEGQPRDAADASSAAVPGS